MKSQIKKIGLLMLFLLGGSMIVKSAVVTDAAAPDFTLTDTNGKPQSLSAYKGKYVVLEWTNYGCPFVKKHYKSANMQGLQKKWMGKDVVWLAICSSAEGKEGYLTAAEWNAASAKQKSTPTAILIDSEGTVGRLYGAKTTPHMFVINPEGVLIYQGAIDDKASADAADIKVAINYVDAALTAAKEGRKVSVPTTTSYGCSVKYK